MLSVCSRNQRSARSIVKKSEPRGDKVAAADRHPCRITMGFAMLNPSYVLTR
jgi:hypothetical protein